MIVIVILAWTVLGPAQVFYIETVDVVRPRGTAVAALGSLWMIEGAATALGNALGGVVAQWVGPHVTLGLAAVMAIGSPIIFTFGMRRSLKPATVPPVNVAVAAD
jgi:predicted MFS family arabinose efflux permease